ncbi:MAG: SDR family NAD(P)-dependent oxidoreductase [Deltaproteobacteria bacterium]|nr:SDR family NAD(P)-dependent oxidoreductase [Deltaproteobacteria bacterium]MCL5792621.1 SDR family NAD(P)-dependent oxidoreductase [Deltaproteobacteria bacterium]
MGLLDGKAAIVTGAGNGIGKSHAIALAKEGAKVVVNDLGGTRDGSGTSTNFADTVVDEIKKMGGKAAANYDSVATIEGAAKIVKTAVDAFGRLDILVNNAGILRDKTLLKMSEAEWDIVISVHLKGTFAMSQAAARVFKEQGQGGKIINTTSIAGLLGNFGQTNYSAAKGGIYSMTKTDAMELEKAGITVNAIAPIAYTRLTEDLPMFQGQEKELAPEYISPVVVFLSSDLAKGITGKIFGVQGRKLYQFYMKMTEGVTRPEGMWTPQDIASQIDKILAE